MKPALRRTLGVLSLVAASFVTYQATSRYAARARQAPPPPDPSLAIRHPAPTKFKTLPPRPRFGYRATSGLKCQDAGGKVTLTGTLRIGDAATPGGDTAPLHDANYAVVFQVDNLDNPPLLLASVKAAEFACKPTLQGVAADYTATIALPPGTYKARFMTVHPTVQETRRDGTKVPYTLHFTELPFTLK